MKLKTQNISMIDDKWWNVMLQGSVLTQLPSLTRRVATNGNPHASSARMATRRVSKVMLHSSLTPRFTNRNAHEKTR
jgi:hypothetical protein